MSTSAARMLAPSTSPRRWVSDSSPATRIQVIPGKKGLARALAWPYILLATVLVILMIAVPMVVNTQMAQRAYEIRDQQILLSELSAQTDTLESELLAAESAQTLQTRAGALGLVPSGAVGSISLANGTVEAGEAAR